MIRLLDHQLHNFKVRLVFGEYQNHFWLILKSFLQHQGQLLSILGQFFDPDFGVKKCTKICCQLVVPQVSKELVEALSRRRDEVKDLGYVHKQKHIV